MTTWRTTKDHETYSSAKGATLDMVKAHDDAIPVPKVIISMDPPEHQKMRKLVSNVFTPRAIESWRAWFARRCTSALTSLTLRRSMWSRTSRRSFQTT